MGVFLYDFSRDWVFVAFVLHRVFVVAVVIWQPLIFLSRGKQSTSKK